MISELLFRFEDFLGISLVSGEWLVLQWLVCSPCAQEDMGSNLTLAISAWLYQSSCLCLMLLALKLDQLRNLYEQLQEAEIMMK